MKRSHLPLIAALAAAAALVSACGKGEAPSMKARANAPLQAPDAKLEAKADNGDANEALKERLARQEAATKLFDRSKPEPAPPPRAEPARNEPAQAQRARAESVAERSESAPQRQPELVRTAGAASMPIAAPAPARTPEVAPAKAEPARGEPAKVEPARQEPAKAEPVRLASAAPTTLPAPTGFVAKLVSRVDPEFPREAIQAGAEKGNVKARMTLDGNGNVTRVEVVEALPRRVFDRAVVRALSQWRFNDGPSGRTVETEVEFKLR